MPDDRSAEDAGPELGLHDLIRSRMHERGWSYSDLERASDRTLTRGRWQQLGSGAPQRRFPDPGSLTVIAQVLEVDITTVVLAAARSVGLDVTHQGAALSHLLPERTELISERMRDAILTLIRAAAAEAGSEEGQEASRASSVGGLRLEWRKQAAPSESTPQQPARSEQP